MFHRSSLEKLHLSPAHLVQLNVPVNYLPVDKIKDPLGANYLLPDTTELFSQKKIADVALGYNEQGIAVTVTVNLPFLGVSLPEYEEGDAIQLFIDTRSTLDKKFISKFCHHIVILPKDFEGMQVVEVTKFRGTEKRNYMDTTLVSVDATFTKKGYRVHLFIPQESLYGYDTSQINHLGFSYIITNGKLWQQSFAASQDNFKIAEIPSLYATLTFSG